jgi:AcrR family transcriptional regulator
MARTVKETEYAKKRNEILDAMQRLLFTKGYERMTIQDIIDDLQISSGAFYHYFNSKPAILEAYIERILKEVEESLLPIVHDPHLSALEKLRGFFASFERLIKAHQKEASELGHVWYADSNAIVRQKMDQAVLEQRAPLLTEIIRQGIGEGVFRTAYPGQAGEIIQSLLQGMDNANARLLFAAMQEYGSMTESSPLHSIERFVTTHAAYMDAIERVLDAPPNSLCRIDAAAAKAWVTMMRKEEVEVSEPQ